MNTSELGAMRIPLYAREPACEMSDAIAKDVAERWARVASTSALSINQAKH